MSATIPEPVQRPGESAEAFAQRIDAYLRAVADQAVGEAPAEAPAGDAPATPEQIYAATLEPVLRGALTMAMIQGWQAAVVVDLGNGQAQTMVVPTPPVAGGVVARTAALLAAGGDIDAYLRRVIEEAGVRGHASVYLDILGVPTDPTAAPPRDPKASIATAPQIGLLARTAEIEAQAARDAPGERPVNLRMAALLGALAAENRRLAEMAGAAVAAPPAPPPPPAPPVPAPSSGKVSRGQDSARRQQIAKLGLPRR